MGGTWLPNSSGLALKQATRLKINEINGISDCELSQCTFIKRMGDSRLIRGHNQQVLESKHSDD